VAGPIAFTKRLDYKIAKFITSDNDNDGTATVSVRSIIHSQIEQIARDQGRKLAPLHDELALLDSGLDSLCFAILVSRLEDQLGSDPFTASEEVNFPVTLGDFVELYENAAR
jgi:aryl carrier-like protein